MDKIDPKMAARVWDRVQAPPKNGLEANALLPMIREEWLDALVLKHLGQSTERVQENAACLKGIYRILTGGLPQMSAPQWKQEKPAVLLRQSFTRRMQLFFQYEKLQHDPRFGPVFGRLAAVSQVQACKVLEILGK